MVSSPTQAFTSQQVRQIDAQAARRRAELHETTPQISSIAKSPESPTQESAESSIPKSTDFLKIIPSNPKAKLAFSELLEQRDKGMLSDHHTQYITGTGKGLLSQGKVYRARSEGETTEDAFTDESDNPEIMLGYFGVSLDHETVLSSANWVMGRGSQRKAAGRVNRNVDVLLAAPRSRYSRGLLPRHALLQMHPDSGVWMISARTTDSRQSSDSPQTSFLIDDKEVLGQEFRCLAKRECRLFISDMEFRVQFALDQYKMCEEFRHTRNEKLAECGKAIPNTIISGIPLATDIRVLDLAVFSLGAGSGSFGSAYEGFDPLSGERRVVKVVELKDERHARFLRPETMVCEQHPNTRGLVRQYGWCNSNGDPELLVKIYPVKVYIVLEQGVAFDKKTWAENLEGPQERPRLLQDLLCGLSTIHAAGWIHRDITKQNILYLEGDPPRAALFDFGKTHFWPSDTDTRLAAWTFLPPELVHGNSNTYDQRIDTWMLALAVVHVWYPRVLQDVSRLHNQQITTSGIQLLRSRLEQVGMQGLLREMLSVGPDSRPTADEALHHQCFKQLADVKQKSVPGGKHSYPDDKAGEPSSKRSEGDKK